MLPDIIEMDGSGADKVYERYGLGSGDGEPEDVETQEIPLTTPAPRLKTLIFGLKRDQRTPPEEITRYSEKPRHLLIRFAFHFFVSNNFCVLFLKYRSRPFVAKRARSFEGWRHYERDLLNLKIIF